MFGDLIYVYFCKNTTLELLLYKMLVNTPARFRRIGCTLKRHLLQR